ncbi:MAG: hypothetical protein IPL96_17715 [Holophagaceae bacterium]|nr:hypothetical protein [Holophagaceae bacterium]
MLLVLRALENDDLTLHLWSGDREEPVKATAEAMSLKGWKSGCSPEGKSEALKAPQGRRQGRGASVGTA